jgi:putative acetyltransferase
MPSLRAATPADAPVIASLRERTIRTVIARVSPPLYTPEEIEAWASNYSESRLLGFIGEGNFLVAEQEGRIVGYGRLAVETPGAGIVRGLFVDASCIGKGIGAAVLTRLLEIARERGLTRVDLVATLNARSFYERHGFVCLERVQHGTPNGAVIPGFKMTRPLVADASHK